MQISRHAKNCVCAENSFGGSDPFIGVGTALLVFICQAWAKICQSGSKNSSRYHDDHFMSIDK